MKLSSPPRPTRKQKGEIAEMAFAAKAMSLGMNVSRPYSETCYDFVVERRGRLARVQVKSGWKEFHGGYPVKISNYYRPYRADELDFLVVFIVPEDAWYVIPVAHLGRGRMASFYPNVPHSRARLEPFREAWELLTRVEAGDPPAKGKKKMGVDRPSSAANKLPRFPIAKLPSCQVAQWRRARAAWSALGDFLFR